MNFSTALTPTAIGGGGDTSVIAVAFLVFATVLVFSAIPVVTCTV